MGSHYNTLLYSKVADKEYTPSHVAEVGVWHPESSNVYQFIEDNIRATLIEPDPESIELIKTTFSDYENVNLHEVALCDFHGEVDLYKRQSSTFVSLLPSSPAIVNDVADLSTTEKFTATAVRFDEVDDGTVDLISIDTEGSEWFAIKNMKSRPSVISIETHGGIYLNPYLSELKKWMSDNNYILWYKDKSDSVYVKPDVIKVTVADRTQLFFTDLIIFLKSLKKRFSLFRKNLFK